MCYEGQFHREEFTAKAAEPHLRCFQNLTGVDLITTIFSMKIRITTYTELILAAKNSIIFLLCLFSFSANGQEEKQYQGFTGIGLPGLAYREGEGFEYGAAAFLFQYGKGDLQPYIWNLSINGSRTTKDRIDLSLQFDSPHFLRRSSRFDLLIEYKRFIYDDFYSLGNQPDYQAEFTEKQSSNFRNQFYYTFRHDWLAFLINWQKPFWKERMKVLVGIGLYDTKVRRQIGETAFARKNPFGSGGGRTNFIRCGIIYDRRDQEAMPSQGFWTDLLIEQAHPVLQSDYSFARVTLTDRRYWSLHPRLVFAQRLLFETMLGRPPFYEMAVIGSSYQRFLGLGGAKTLRGMPRLFLIGQSKLLGNLELRWRVISMTILRQPLTFYLQPFVDVGRVWLAEDPLSLKHLHFAEGLGIHVRWKKDFVAALDIGRSRYLDYAIYATFGNLF